MKDYKLGVLRGDGIGPEIIDATLDIIQASIKQIKVNKLRFEILHMGWEAIKKYNNPLPDKTKEALAHMDGWIMGPHDSASYPSEYGQNRNPSGELRHFFDLYANIRPTKTIHGIESVVRKADLVIFRENTEGFYSDRNMMVGSGEWQITPEVVVSSGVFTKRAIQRIARDAFEMAMERRKKVTIVHKANVIRLGMGLFKNTCLEVGKEFPEVEVNDYHVDAMVAHLVRGMEDFDVIITENMCGDILSDLTAELAGGLGLSPSINTNGHKIMAQAAHGSAPDIAGENTANPVGMLLSSSMLFQWLGKRHEDKQLLALSDLIDSSTCEVIAEGIKTPDLGGRASTSSFTKMVINKIKENE